MQQLNDLVDVFFFSSRRRHTRFDCDWSSDVCSSDLQIAPAPGDHIAYSSAPSKFHEHRVVVNQHSEFRPLSACGGAGRMTCDGSLCKSRVIVAASRNGPKCLPSSEGFLADNQIAR